MSTLCISLSYSLMYTAIGMMQQPCTGAQPQATKVEAEYR